MRQDACRSRGGNAVRKWNWDVENGLKKIRRQLETKKEKNHEGKGQVNTFQPRGEQGEVVGQSDPGSEPV